MISCIFSLFFLFPTWWIYNLDLMWPRCSVFYVKLTHSKQHDLRTSRVKIFIIIVQTNKYIFIMMFFKYENPSEFNWTTELLNYFQDLSMLAHEKQHKLITRFFPYLSKVQNPRNNILFQSSLRGRTGFSYVWKWKNPALLW